MAPRFLCHFVGSVCILLSIILKSLHFLKGLFLTRFSFSAVSIGFCCGLLLNSFVYNVYIRASSLNPLLLRCFDPSCLELNV